jgi:hypothetical protein
MSGLVNKSPTTLSSPAQTEPEFGSVKHWWKNSVSVGLKPFSARVTVQRDGTPFGREKTPDVGVNENDVMVAVFVCARDGDGLVGLDGLSLPQAEHKRIEASSVSNRMLARINLPNTPLRRYFALWAPHICKDPQPSMADSDVVL